MHVRVPKLHKRIYEQAAAAAGLPLGDYVAIALAEAHQLDKPDYVQREQEEALPLGA